MRPNTVHAARALLSVGGLVLVMGSTGCSTNREPAPDGGTRSEAASRPVATPAPGGGGAAAEAPPSGTVRVRGRLTDEGVECQALRGDDGKLYTLGGDLKGFKTGDRVVVEGTVAEMSICMQGTTIGVTKIERAG